jgi:hypothetical protein
VQIDESAQEDKHLVPLTILIRIRLDLRTLTYTISTTLIECSDLQYPPPDVSLLDEHLVPTRVGCIQISVEGEMFAEAMFEALDEDGVRRGGDSGGLGRRGGRWGC